MLEAEGYVVTRAAGSKGMWDLIAYYPGRSLPWRVIQVKVGARISRPEREAIQLMLVPWATKEVWHFRDRVEKPEITVI
jgi:hypothetical protein